jgi:hypothetical protein
MITTVLYGTAVLGIYFAFGINPKPLRRFLIPKKVPNPKKEI